MYAGNSIIIHSGDMCTACVGCLRCTPAIYVRWRILIMPSFASENFSVDVRGGVNSLRAPRAC